MQLINTYTHNCDLRICHCTKKPSYGLLWTIEYRRMNVRKLSVTQHVSSSIVHCIQNTPTFLNFSTEVLNTQLVLRSFGAIFLLRFLPCCFITLIPDLTFDNEYSFWYCKYHSSTWWLLKQKDKNGELQ